MLRNNEILNELEQLSMVIAGISRELPYEAPDGYFSEFPGKCLARLERLSPNALASSEPVPNAVAPNAPSPSPDPNPSWGKGPSMSVPDGYFENFASRMMDKIRAQENEHSSILDSIGKTMPYQVPADYFETSLPSATLLALKDKSVYEVPEGYFESLPEIIAARVQAGGTAVKESPAKLISMEGRRKSMDSRRKTAWLKYAAAAVMAGVILTFGWLRMQTPSSKQHTQPVASLDVSQDLVNVSDQDIENYVDDHTQQIQQVQQEEDYATSTASLDISDNDAKNLLGDVPDGELTQYMEEHGGLQDYPTN
jgi:hypothetical protein